MEDGASIQPGGFLHSLPSPAPSNISTTSTSSLPHPRARPLRPGSEKEDATRRYIDNVLMKIARRYAKKFLPPEGDELVGYTSMSDVARDLSSVVDVLWISGTPSLQIPYLLNVALKVTEYITAFDPAPPATFKLLKKLDHAFSSLMKGEDSLTGDLLPGFEGGRSAGMTKTDMVRCKSLVEATRILIVEHMTKPPEQPNPENDEDVVMESETDAEGNKRFPEPDEQLEMDVARVYEMSIVCLNEKLDSGGFTIGVATGSR
ncbi:hypothetical protein HYFRA_00003509 [Hymenoscyphus fraxineus]|uniref:Meiotic recombination protein DMC1 n=1 Tax=Hymenoscyphus fraxineus TaxID=746836 RepID=A0A9N9PTA7_9HELO|nr:hypothetical protein HYFRA_00003509 [Hymenoscyphus fraxineus]